MTGKSDTFDETLLQTLMNQATPTNLNRLSTALDESPQVVQTTLAAAAPILIAGLARTAATGSGARSLMDLIQRFGFDRADASAAVMPALDDPTQQGTGATVLQAILGHQADAMARTVARSSGAKPSSVTALFTVLGPMLLGIVGRKLKQGAEGRGPAWLSSYLAMQETLVAEHLPAGWRAALSPSTTTTTDAGSNVAKAADARGAWILPLAAVAALVVAGIWLYNIRQGPTTAPSSATVSSLGAVVPEAAVPASTTTTAPAVTIPVTVMDTTIASGVPTSHGNTALRDALANLKPEDLPKVITFSEINFDFGTANLDPPSEQIVDDLGAVLAAHPNVILRLEGHTDGVGDAEANHELSTERAKAVRDRLAMRGIDTRSFVIVGRGDEQPVAANDTDAGRALNRRVEVVIVGLQGDEGLAH